MQLNKINYLINKFELKYLMQSKNEKKGNYVTSYNSKKNVIDISQLKTTPIILFFIFCGFIPNSSNKGSSSSSSSSLLFNLYSLYSDLNHKINKL